MGIFIPTKLNSDYGLSVILKKIQKLHKLKLAWIFRLNSKDLGRPISKQCVCNIIHQKKIKAFDEADPGLEIKNKKHTFYHESRGP